MSQFVIIDLRILVNIAMVHGKRIDLHGGGEHIVLLMLGVGASVRLPRMFDVGSIVLWCIVDVAAHGIDRLDKGHELFGLVASVSPEGRIP